MLTDAINHVIDKHDYNLIPRINRPNGITGDNLRSAIIVPIMIVNDCHGVIYIANGIEHEHYTIADLDYVALCAIHTGSLLSRIMTIL
jgi:hypothetical protein